MNGHFEMLIWLKQTVLVNNLSSDTFYFAAKYGHLDILIWFKSYNYYFDFRVCSYAAFNGDLDMLLWARSSGCYWNNTVFTYAALNGDVKLSSNGSIENRCDKDYEI